MPKKIEGLPALHIAGASVVAVSGEDAYDYLQSQVSQDLSPLQKGVPVYTLWLNRKGQILTDCHIVPSVDDPAGYFCMRPFEGASDAFIEMAAANVIADDVEFATVDDGWKFLTLVAATEELREILAKSDVAAGMIVTDPLAGETVVRGYFPAKQCDAWLSEWLESSKVSCDGGLAVARRQLEQACLLPDAGVLPGDLPHDVGLQDTAVSYRKGCYLGQEVMARLKAMGRARNVVRRVRVAAGNENPSFDREEDGELAAESAVAYPAAELFVEDQRVGSLRLWVGNEGLAVLHARRVEDMSADVPFSLASGGRPALTLCCQLAK